MTKAVFLGFQGKAGAPREPREGLTIGKVYDITKGQNSCTLHDDNGAPRCRPVSDFVEEVHTRKAWARFPSLQAVFG